MTDQGRVPGDRGEAWVDQDERELIRRAAQDAVAFSALYRRHAPDVVRYVQRRCADSHLCEDVVAEVFVAALEGIGRFRFRGIPFVHWLYRVAGRVLRRELKRRERRESSPLTEDLRTPPGPPTTTMDGVRRALSGLPWAQQEVLTLFYLEDLTVEEIAGTVGCRVGTVKSRLSRGREALRPQLQEHAPRPRPPARRSTGLRSRP